MTAPPLDQNAFMTSTSLVLGERESLNVITGYATVDDCVGSFNYTVCELQSAVGQYEVAVSGNDTTLLAAEDPRIIVRSPMRTFPPTSEISANSSGCLNS